MSITERSIYECSIPREEKWNKRKYFQLKIITILWYNAINMPSQITVKGKYIYCAVNSVVYKKATCSQEKMRL